MHTLYYIQRNDFLNEYEKFTDDDDDDAVAAVAAAAGDEVKNGEEVKSVSAESQQSVMIFRAWQAAREPHHPAHQFHQSPSQ
uniref:Uncharacterized protein n=1 Tax=Bracon brevicornis TaxID=1563983 RepID=A0A6V7JMB0_9HYME